MKFFGVTAILGLVFASGLTSANPNTMISFDISVYSDPSDNFEVAPDDDEERSSYYDDSEGPIEVVASASSRSGALSCKSVGQVCESGGECCSGMCGGSFQCLPKNSCVQSGELAQAAWQCCSSNLEGDVCR